SISANLRDGNIDVALTEKVDAIGAEIAEENGHRTEISLQVQIPVLGIYRVEVIDECLGIGHAGGGDFGRIDRQGRAADGGPVDEWEGTEDRIAPRREKRLVVEDPIASAQCGSPVAGELPGEADARRQILL